MVAFLVGIVGIKGSYVGESLTWEEQAGRSSMQPVKTDFACMAG